MRLGSLTDGTFGIYLSHSPLFALWLQLASGQPAEALPVAIFTLAFAATWALRRLLPRWPPPSFTTAIGGASFGGPGRLQAN